MDKSDLCQKHENRKIFFKHQVSKLLYTFPIYSTRYYTIIFYDQKNERVFIVDTIFCLYHHYKDAENESSREN